MKIYKVFKNSHKILAYVKVSESVCKAIFDTSYAALQLVRCNYNDDSINGTQLVDVNESLEPGVPILTISTWRRR
jgi:hypothetical protein